MLKSNGKLGQIRNFDGIVLLPPLRGCMLASVCLSVFLLLVNRSLNSYEWISMKILVEVGVVQGKINKFLEDIHKTQASATVHGYNNSLIA